MMLFQTIKKIHKFQMSIFILITIIVICLVSYVFLLQPNNSSSITITATKMNSISIIDNSMFDPFLIDNSSFDISNESTISKLISPYKLELTPPNHEISITISALGDCTIGTDETFAYTEPFYTFDEIFLRENQDYSYFFKNVLPITGKDDLTIANLETTFTDATLKAEKKFRFKGPMDYVNILLSGSIEAVNLANNHIKDYLTEGRTDTIEALCSSNIAYFEEKDVAIMTIKGIKIGMLGFQGWFDDDSTKKSIEKGIQALKDDNCQLIIISFHWGIDRSYEPYSVQTNLAHYSIDQGADLVLGHHPHVLQGIETYKNRNIVYSLGNFCFGGNHNPEDFDTMIYQETFIFEDAQLKRHDSPSYTTIPFSVSSISEYNNFQPTPLSGDDALRLQEKIDNLSEKIVN